MIAQDRVSIECYVRQADQRWLLHETNSLDQTVRFDSIKVTVAVAELYRNIRFKELDAGNSQHDPERTG